MGGWCGKFSNYMGHWCPTKSNYMGGWYFVAWKGKKEYHLPQKRRSFIKSSQTASETAIFVYMQSPKLGCFRPILVKNGKKWYPNKLPNSGFCSGHYFTWETCIFRRIYLRKQRYRVVRLLVKAKTCKNLYQ